MLILVAMVDEPQAPPRLARGQHGLPGLGCVDVAEKRCSSTLVTGDGDHCQSAVGKCEVHDRNSEPECFDDGLRQLVEHRDHVIWQGRHTAGQTAGHGGALLG